MCRSEKAIQCFLIQDATLAIIADNLSLKPIRLNLRHVVIIDMLANLLNSGGRFDNGSHLDSACKVCAFLFGQAFRKLGKCFVNCILVDMKVNRDCFKIQWERSAIADGVRERVFAHVAGSVFCGTECNKCISIKAVNRGTGQAKEERIWQAKSHLCTQVTFLCSMRFIHHNNDIGSRIEHLVHFIEEENRCDKYFSGIALEKLNKAFLVFCDLKIWHTGGAECRIKLRFQINAIQNNHNGGVAQVAHHAKFLRSKDHQQRLAATLEVPNEALLRIAGANALNDSVCSFILLITADNLVLLILLIGREQRKVTEDIQNDLFFRHCAYAALNIGQCALTLVIRRVPWTPMRHIGLHGSIAIAFALGSKVKDIGYKHLRDTLLVIKNVLSAINPGDGFVNRSLDFAD